VDELDLLFRRLVIAAHAAGALERPIEIGEILDKFAPYKAAKRDGLLDTNDDYLHALMRLIAGEREMLFADDLLQDDFRAELDSPNPELAALRSYATSKVRIATVLAQTVLAGDIDIDMRPPTPLATASAPPKRTSGTAPAMAPKFTPVVAPAVVPPPEPVTEPRRRGAPFSAAPESPVAAPPTAAPAVEAFDPANMRVNGCPYCAQPIPEGRPIKFCPTCGQNLLVRRCPGCSAEIESGWKFCVTCGRKA
jgi:hypothetical protein